jgi:peptide/nickel transport system substrate-binding protein
MIGILLSGCIPEEDFPLGAPEPIRVESDLEPQPSPIPEKVLSICLGAEPASLFIYGNQSTSARIIRQAIYDGPVDQVNFQITSPILVEIPSQENKLVSISEIEVFPGDQIVDVYGNLTILASGVEYRPSGCDDPECWEIYQNQDSVRMDQVEIKYQFKPDLTWSDGKPLTGEDSVFSYLVAKEIYGSSGPRTIRNTAHYEVTDNEGEIIWKGMPGFRGIYSYTDYLFSPLPEHKLGNLSIYEILNSDLVNYYPLGWGPYEISEWILGDHLTLLRNEAYHLISEGLPVFDAVTFRFVEGGEEALAAYLSGECEIVLNENGLFEHFSKIRTMEGEGEINIAMIDGGAWEQISFGISSLNTRRTLLQDSEMRRALSQCLDREEIVIIRDDAGTSITNLYHPQDPRYHSPETTYSYDLQESINAMEEVGWIDHDQDASTPRISLGVDGVRNNTPLRLSLLTVESEDEPTTALKIKEQLENCGVEIVIEELPAGEFLAPGPDGPVFGRDFDLALFAWSTGNFHLCQIFTSREIPGLYPAYPKGWGGANAPGYSNADFDAACHRLTNDLPDSTETDNDLMTVQEIFTEDLPVLPLFFRQDIILSNPELEGIVSGIYPPLWNIESLK